MQGGKLPFVLLTVLLLGVALPATPAAEAQYPEPEANFRWFREDWRNPGDPVAGEEILFQDVSKPGAKAIYRWWWDWDDGERPQMRVRPWAFKNFSEPGVYDVGLTVYNYFGQTDSTNKTVTIRPGLSVAYDLTRNGATVEVDASATTSPYGEIAWYRWDWGDNTTSNVTTARTSHTFAAPGDYIIRLNVTDEQYNPGRTTPRLVSIQDAPPVAAFTVDPDPALTGRTLTFADATRSGFAPLTSWTWLVDGIESGTGRTLTRAFAEPATLNVTLRVADEKGFTDETTRTVRVSAPPVAAFEPSLAEMTLAVDATNSTDPDGRIVDYAWDWGDGTPPGGNATARHAYAAAGDYLVNLTVTDDDGVRTSATRLVRVEGGTAVSAFDILPAQPKAGEEVRFLDASFDSAGEIQAWRWEFGDGATSDAREPVHVYAKPGRYQANLTVTDSGGLLARGTRLVVVDAAPPPPPPTRPATPSTPTPVVTTPPVVVTEDVPEVEPTEETPTPTTVGTVATPATPTTAATPPDEKSFLPAPGVAALLVALVAALALLRRRG